MEGLQDTERVLQQRQVNGRLGKFFFFFFLFCHRFPV